MGLEPRRAARVHTTAERARSPLSALGQTRSGFLSASQRRDAQRAAYRRQQAKDRAGAILRYNDIRESEGAGADSSRGGGGHKGACGGEETKGLVWGLLRRSWLT
eukprot:7380447-Prymnesium_polylepis.1